MKFRKQKIQQKRDAEEMLKIIKKKKKGKCQDDRWTRGLASSRCRWELDNERLRAASEEMSMRKQTKQIERFIILSEDLVEISDCCMETEV